MASISTPPEPPHTHTHPPISTPPDPHHPSAPLPAPLNRKEQVPLFLAWRDNYEVRDIKAMAMYSRLLSTLLTRPELREGEWAPCVTSPSMDQNPSYKSIVSHVLWDKFGNCLLIVVNYNYEWANGHVTLPPDVVVGKRYHVCVCCV